MESKHLKASVEVKVDKSTPNSQLANRRRREKMMVFIIINKKYSIIIYAYV